MVGIYKKENNTLISKDGPSYSLKKDTVNVIKKPNLKIKQEGFVFILSDNHYNSWLIKTSRKNESYNNLNEGSFELRGLTKNAKNFKMLIQNNNTVLIFK